MGTLTRGRPGLLVLLVALVGVIGVPAASAQGPADCAADHTISIDALLLNPNSEFAPGEATVALPAPIPAGDYILTMVSYDEHSSKLIDQSDQVNEQWYLELLDAQDDVVFQSGVSPDLPDEQDWLTFTSSAAVTGEAVTMRVRHAAIGTNVNSIIASCAGFTPVPTGTIGDTVWADDNRNGIQDDGETGLAGVPVSLSGAATADAVTDADGRYMFDGLAAGHYSVTVGDGPTDTALTTPGAVDVALGVGQGFADADFGFAPVVVEPALGTIGDAVWSDDNGNGWMDGSEAGLPGVRVVVTHTGGTLDAVTNTDGRYRVDGLAAGSYEVTVDMTTVPAGTALTTAPVRTVDLTAGATFLDADFGVGAAGVKATATVGDLVWMDTNLNGLFDSGEGVLSGVTLTLKHMADGTTATAVSASNGKYLFVGLPAGDYEVRVMTGTAPNSVALTTAGVYSVTLAEGQTSLIADFGFAQALPSTGFETADFGIAGLVLLLIGGAALVLVRPAGQTPWHLVDAYEVH
ncbi:MAG: carboxypeptidase regulatory-like domain-containing protein [Acidimicrobiia bacterium]|nr:carboxypeptidase regulatory-like domain-containing protein [Acidimicrobiia bacterium]